MGLYDRIQNGWNAFIGRDPTKRKVGNTDYGMSFSLRPDRPYYRRDSYKSIVTHIYNRIAVDCAAITMEHVQLDDNEGFDHVMKSGLNQCLTLSANIDQTSRAFLQEVYAQMLDSGHAVIVPVDTIGDPYMSDSYTIRTMRVGRVTEWFPAHVRVELYDEHDGRKKELILAKKTVAIVQNPFYSVMNEPNSYLQRLIRTTNQLDKLNDQSASGKLDLIIQLPYIVKSQARRAQAEMRRKDIEMQLAGSKYGVAYTDGTEKIVQLNRSLENNLLAQVQDLTTRVYNQLGLSDAIVNGTADEVTSLNYFNQTIEPIVSAVVDEMKRKFLTKTALTQKQTILSFRDPFRLVPTGQLADLVQKLTTAEVMSPNEFRQIIGLKPAQDPTADELRNRNLNKMEGEVDPNVGSDMMDPGAPVEEPMEELPEETLEEPELEEDPMVIGEDLFKKLYKK